MVSSPIKSQGLGPWIAIFLEFIVLGPMDGNFPDEFIGFGATDGDLRMNS